MLALCGEMAKQGPLRQLSSPQLPSQLLFEFNWPWVATQTDQLKTSEISLGKDFLSLALIFFFNFYFILGYSGFKIFFSLSLSHFP